MTQMLVRAQTSAQHYLSYKNKTKLRREKILEPKLFINIKTSFTLGPTCQCERFTIYLVYAVEFLLIVTDKDR